MSLVVFRLSAQSQPKPTPLRVEALLHYGRIFKHTPNFNPTINGPAVGGEIALMLQTTGKHTWERPYGYPSYGLAVSFVRYNNDSVLGLGFGFLPQVFIPVFRRGVFQADFKIGTGVAFLTKHYDVIKNPQNNVIATGVNNITSAGLRMRVDVTQRWSILGGGSFTHYSTGDTRLPNLGINVPMINLGASYTINPVPYGEYFSAAPPDKRKGVALKARATIARFEAAQRNGPVFTQLGLEAGAMKYLGNWNKLALMVDGYYNSYTYFWLYDNEFSRGKQFERSLGSSLIIEDEVLLGRVGMTGAVGIILYQPEMSGGAYYEQLGVQYHFLNLEMQTHKDKMRNLFAGVYLKTHWANAEFVKLGLGIEL